jgi:hypothetical protein
MQLASPTDYGDAREAVVRIAGILGLPVEDDTGGRSISLTPEQAGKSLQEQATQGEFQFDDAPKPAAMVSRVKADEESVTLLIRLPKPGIGTWLGAIVPPLVLVLFLPKLLSFFHDTGTPPIIGAIVTAFLGLFFGVVPLLGGLNAVRRARRGGTRVKVDWRGVIIQERSAWKTTTRQIRAEDIWAVDCATVASRLEGRLVQEEGATGLTEDGPEIEFGKKALHPLAEKMITGLATLAKSEGVLFKTRQGIVMVGGGLPDDELRYIRGLFERALAAQLMHCQTSS